VLCETGDACGAYPLLGGSSVIILDGSISTLGDLNFEVGYHTTSVSP